MSSTFNFWFFKNWARTQGMQKPSKTNDNSELTRPSLPPQCYQTTSFLWALHTHLVLFPRSGTRPGQAVQLSPQLLLTNVWLPWTLELFELGNGCGSNLATLKVGWWTNMTKTSSQGLKGQCPNPLNFRRKFGNKIGLKCCDGLNFWSKLNYVRKFYQCCFCSIRTISVWGALNFEHLHGWMPRNMHPPFVARARFTRSRFEDLRPQNNEAPGAPWELGWATHCTCKYATLLFFAERKPCEWAWSWVHTDLTTATQYRRCRNGGHVGNSGASRAAPVPKESQGRYNLTFEHLWTHVDTQLFLCRPARQATGGGSSHHCERAVPVVTANPQPTPSHQTW